MPTIRIDGDVWKWLKKQAEPFEDTPNSILRRVAQLDAQHAEPNGEMCERLPRKPVGRPRGEKTPQAEFRYPLMRILLRHGGSYGRTRALRELEVDLGDRLTIFDKSEIKSGSVRWLKSADWEVSVLRQEGLILPRAESPYGVWCLSPNGLELTKRIV